MSEVTSLPTVHAKLGASSAYRWMTCAGSVNLSEGIEDKSSPYAREGTAAHELAARVLTTGGSPEDYVGDTITVVEGEDDDRETFDIEVTDEMATAVRVYVDIVREKAAMGNIVLIEETASLESLNPPRPMFGTADAVVYRRNDKHLDVVDYKHGQGVAVDAAGNPQLKYYALLAVVSCKVKPDTITVTIVQPRAHHEDGPVRADTFTWDDLVAFKKELFEAAEATLAEDAPLVAGAHCRFCPALAICPAQARQAVEVAQSEFAVVEDQSSLPAPGSLTDEQLRMVLDKKDVIEKWFAAVYDHVRDRLEKGEGFSGYKLVPKRANRKWIDEEKAGTYLQRKLGKRGAYTEKVISPAQAEKALKAAEGDVPSYLENLYEQKSSGYNLAPSDDPREPVDLVQEAQDEFAVLPPGKNDEWTDIGGGTYVRADTEKQETE